MKIAILGIGGVGGFYGGKLASYYSGKNDHEIIFIARGNHRKAILENGLCVMEGEKSFVTKPDRCVEDMSTIGIVDVLLVCVKTYSLLDAIQSLKENISKDTIIIPLMNGIEPYEILKNEFPDSNVFQGCCYCNAFIESPGVVRFRGGFDQVLIGSSDSKNRKVVADLFSAAGINVFDALNISKQIWEKFIFGSAVSSIGSLENESFGEIISNPEREHLLRGLISECVLIANANKIIFENDFVEKLIQKISSYPFEARTSMQLDFATGKKTEVETFTGFVVREGKLFGIEVPFYNEVYWSLRNKEDNRSI